MDLTFSGNMLIMPLVEMIYLALGWIFSKEFLRSSGGGLAIIGLTKAAIILEMVGKYKISEYMSKIDFSNNSYLSLGLKLLGPFCLISVNLILISNPKHPITTVKIINVVMETEANTK